jgi:hypothetical protein
MAFIVMLFFHEEYSADKFDVQCALPLFLLFIIIPSPVLQSIIKYIDGEEKKRWQL